MKPPHQLNPVILPVPQEKQALKGRQSVRFLSTWARQALEICGKIHGIRFEKLEKNARQVPIPVNGIYWSLSHKKRFVCAVLGDSPVGIDVEEIRPLSENLFERIASPKEWHLFRERNPESFARVWTAKECLLKALGIGIAGLRKCQICEVLSDFSLILEFEKNSWKIFQKKENQHFFSMTSQIEKAVVWHFHQNPDEGI